VFCGEIEALKSHFKSENCLVSVVPKRRQSLVVGSRDVVNVGEGLASKRLQLRHWNHLVEGDFA